ncbi:Aldehyde dehydrogenase [Mycena indigotica]|uniref:Aldehyde dehydrogenase n=1 Tax=Mycena indigotica TaxID=2126181 RepID=A0A8H6VVX1_9AGAR|nr:Aldehyde dehydrogenase [Mycena indigotica]KAF7292083.1 Aldehyde dehydrogenase [Mycena indigotica]
MATTFSYTFDSPAYKGTSTFETGVYIDGKFRDGANGTTIDVINPATGELITKVAEAVAADVDAAVIAAQKAFDTVWGLKANGARRSELLNKLASLMEAHSDELAALEALDNGKTLFWAKNADIRGSIATIKYYASLAQTIAGQTIETDESKMTYTRHEPIGVVGQIIPWNFPLLMMSWKIGPALATGNTIVLKPSELTPLTALRMGSLIKEAGFPDGVVNILIGYGPVAGQAIAEHNDIEKVAFTGSTLVGRKIMTAAANSNLKDVTLELGGKSPTIIFDDADLDQAVKWAVHGIFWNQGQSCIANSRVYVQDGIYDAFVAKFVEAAKNRVLGDPMAATSEQGPQVSKGQLDRIMGFIKSGKEAGATLLCGGEQHGTNGYFVQPTLFTDVSDDMEIVREEIFGPVGVLIRFTDPADAIKRANDTKYGLAASVFTENLKRAIETANQLKAGTVGVNTTNNPDPKVPFGGYKQSGIGRELGEYALRHYTAVKAVHLNLGWRL